MVTSTPRLSCMSTTLKGVNTVTARRTMGATAGASLWDK